jgi:hypothetical protein
MEVNERMKAYRQLAALLMSAANFPIRTVPVWCWLPLFSHFSGSESS